jgi:hypothetical protein
MALCSAEGFFVYWIGAAAAEGAVGDAGAALAAATAGAGDGGAAAAAAAAVDEAAGLAVFFDMMMIPG